MKGINRTTWLLILLVLVAGYWLFGRVMENEADNPEKRGSDLSASEAETTIDEEFDLNLRGHELLISEEYVGLFQHIDDYYERYKRGELQVWHVSRMLNGTALPFPEDREFYDNFIGHFSDSPYSYLLRGRYLSNLGYRERGAAWASLTSDEQFAAMRERHDQALDDFKQAISLDSTLMEAHAGLIKLYGTRENAERLAANAELRQIIAGGFDDPLQDLKGSLLAAYKSAVAPAKSVEFYQAFDAALAINPADSAIWQSYFHSLRPRWGGSYEELDKAYEKVTPYIEQNSYLADLKWIKRWDLVSGAAAAGREDDAIVLLKDALGEGNYSRGHYWMGLMHYRKGNYQEAVKSHRKALLTNPIDAEVYLRRSYAYATLNQYDRAIKDIDKFQKLKGEDWHSICAKAYATGRDAGVWREAIPLYERCLEQQPNYKDQTYQLGMLTALQERLAHEVFHGASVFLALKELQQEFSLFDTEIWLQHITDDSRSRLKPAELEATFAGFRHLGDLVSVQEPEIVDVMSKSQCDEGSYHPVRYKSDMQFEKGRARLLLDVCKQRGIYTASGFTFFHD